MNSTSLLIKRILIVDYLILLRMILKSIFLQEEITIEFRHLCTIVLSVKTVINLKLTSLLKSAGIRQSYPNSIRIPNCTPVMGIGAPTLYVNLNLAKGNS